MSSYLYMFEFADRNPVEFQVSLDPQSNCSATCPVNPPEWTRLQYHQCSICSLDPHTSPYCPVALNIADLVITFHDVKSYQPCKVVCISSERAVSKQTTVQDGIASIVGLQMAISGCPVMDFFRPMARFHLPFATVDESIFRVVACYLLTQLYKSDKTQQCTSDLADIKDLYARVKNVNKGMLERIKNVSISDADRNAIVTLNSLAQILEMEIDANLETLAHIFR